ncbi:MULTISPECIES: MetQ/NlpA family ABC transporter substrate-binding protein [unclassified Aureimonas]|uniref:MetQ/NlpA family ABC transporter substrate-binding protein n=1 Tax=unclassified Aureimonas TaxID=2615206 RepID=UPI0006F4FBEA|nr:MULTISPECIES: MetQ/NlpA family ABC transporter substrate-binding protein [unclassified Aureimonas]KQT52464.1 metal ABC transporter substrate-binding protein [Aureimonas sp. Leaf427]KQT77635.1 metal ABC transporter substrate-binding protein [Aureimonas sp. Leaf460]
MKSFLLAGIASALLLSVSPGIAASLKIGVTPGAYADSVATAAEEAKAQGLDVEVVEFSDWTTPNIALQAGDIDANYFQHKPFLHNAIADRGYDFTDIGIGTLANIGLYSLKHKSFDEIPEGGSVAIANDPVNQGRGLLLLEKAGLIKLKEGVGFKGTLDDIVENPRKLTFTEVEGPQLVRVTGDVDLALGYPHFIVAAKAFDPASGLIYSGIDDRQFAIRFVVKKDRAEDADLKKFVTIYQTSPKVRETIGKAFANDPKLYTIAWEE